MNLSSLSSTVLDNLKIWRWDHFISQLQTNAQGQLEFYPIEDEANMDKRRQSVGLEPLAEYAKHFGLEYHSK
jgi:hypothetical protein